MAPCLILNFPSTLSVGTTGVDTAALPSRAIEVIAVICARWDQMDSEAGQFCPRNKYVGVLFW